MKKYITIIIILILIIASYICYYHIDIYSGQIKLLVNDEEITIDEVREKGINLKELGTSINIKNLNNKTVIINNRRVKSNKTINLNLKKLGKPIKVKTNTGKYYINTLPSNFPNITISGKSVSDGKYYALSECNADTYIYDLDSKGNVLYYKKTKYKTTNYLRESNNRYSYLDMEKIDHADFPFYAFVLLDENHNEIDRVRYTDTIGVDPHQILYLEDNHYIISTYKDEIVDNFPVEIKGTNHMRVQSSLLKEIKDGKVLWEFDATNYDKLYKYFDERGVIEQKRLDDYYYNYMHFNNMVIDPKDNNLLVSFRNICAIIKINRENGQIMWILGGKGDEFNMKEEEKFLFQHSISFIDDNTISLYDNGTEDRNSRIVTFKIDEENKTISDYYSYDLDLYTTNWGYVEPIKDDIFLINYGQNSKVNNNKAEEINIKTGEVLFSIDFNESPTYFTHKYMEDN